MSTTEESRAGIFWPTFSLHSVAALVIIVFIHSSFRDLVDSLGQPQKTPVTMVAALISAVVICQICYWFRLTKIEMPRADRAILGHLLVFGGRVASIFGGALFAVFFLRHLPDLARDHDAFALFWRGIVAAATVFALHCYVLELERLGTSFQLAYGIGGAENIRRSQGGNPN